MTIHIFLWFLWKNEYENIVTSQEKLGQFIQEKLSGYKVNPVAGDDICMLHAFHKGINTTLGKAIPLDEITTNLRKWFLTNYKSYQSFSDDSVNVLVELEKFLSDPLRYCNSYTSDSFLIALGKTYDANIIVYKSNSEKCWIPDYTNEQRASKVTLYFAKILSEHIDPLLPVPSRDLDDDTEITAFVPGNDVFAGIEIKQEDDITNDESVVIVEELSSSVSYTRMEVKSEATKWYFSLFDLKII